MLNMDEGLVKHFFSLIAQCDNLEYFKIKSNDLGLKHIFFMHPRIILSHS